MRNDVFIKEDILLDENYTDGEIAVLVALNSIIVGDLTANYINYITLCSALYDRKPSESEKRNIKQYLNKLIDKKEITLVKEIDKNTITCNVTKVFVEINNSSNENKTYYTCISKDEIHTIMNIHGVNNFSLLRVHLCYLKTFHRGHLLEEQYRGKIGFIPMDYIKDKTNKHKLSMFKYNSMLEEYKLLYIVRHKPQNIEGITKGTTNTYSRYSDKELCDEYVSLYKTNYHTDKSLNLTKFKQSNHKKFKNLIQGHEYSLYELYEIKEYILLHNQDINKGLVEGKLIDISIIEENIEDAILLGADEIEYRYQFYENDTNSTTTEIEVEKNISVHNHCLDSFNADFSNHKTNTYRRKSSRHKVGLYDFFEEICLE